MGNTPTTAEGGKQEISAGGDQPLRCRDQARVGVLLANNVRLLDTGARLQCSAPGSTSSD